MDTLTSPFGDYHLSRWPVRDKDELRAWNAADELLLQHVHQHIGSDQLSNRRILVVNDEFGALGTVLGAYDVTHWSDSFIAQQALEHNCGANAIDTTPACVGSLEPLAAKFDLVLIKVPKTTALLEDQLHRLKPHLQANAVVVAGAMVKHLQRSAFDVFEKLLGPVTTSLSEKKARLLFVALDDTLDSGNNPYPTTYNDRQVGFPLVNHANLFSRDHLDLGARFLITQIGDIKPFDSVTDLGCGNGVLGIVYAQKHPSAAVHFIDESYMAIASAMENVKRAKPEIHGQVTFTAGDGLSDTPDNSTGLILCNPPFHQQHVVGDSVGTRMIQHAKRVLQQHGEIWLVANRQLNYQVRLKRLFGNCRKVDSNAKFVVLKAIKR